MAIISRGFRGRGHGDIDPSRIPPGQYPERGFPVLTYGPTPRLETARWSFGLSGLVDPEVSWTWDEFNALPQETVTVDIHCVTKWTKLDTTWTGVSLDTILERVSPKAAYVTAWSEGGYTTNLPLADLRFGKAWVVHTYDGKPLERQHGGPARLLVPHLYFWKSAKWVRGLRFTAEDEPGFWEVNGYHDYGDPWREQRYQGD